MIAIEDLTVQLGGVRPLDGLTVDLDAPVHGVIGPNGAGKTTLLNVLSGFLRASSGSLTVDGVAMEALAARRRAARGVRRTFQAERLAPQLTGRENVAVAADGLVRRGERVAATERALAFVGLADAATPVVKADGYSRRLVELARALVGAPKLVLLDEPSGGLSGAESDAFEGLIRAIPGEYGAQVVLVEHDVDLIARTCERVTVLDFGSLLASGETADVLQDDRVRAAWLGTAEVA